MHIYSLIEAAFISNDSDNVSLQDTYSSQKLIADIARVLGYYNVDSPYYETISEFVEQDISDLLSDFNYDPNNRNFVHLDQIFITHVIDGDIIDLPLFLDQSEVERKMQMFYNLEETLDIGDSCEILYIDLCFFRKFRPLAFTSYWE